MAHRSERYPALKLARKAAAFVNKGLSLIGLEIIRTSANRMEMFAALARVRQHEFPIKSVIDIGAAEGKWSAKAMAIFPDCRFLAIEPLEEQKAALDALKKRKQNFDYALCAAGEIDQSTAYLNVTADLDGSTIAGADGQARRIPVRTIDGLIAEKNLPGPYLIKFDTHGYEIPILNGAAKTLKNTEVIVMEAYNFQITPHALRFHEMCSRLEEIGFRCFDIADPIVRKYDKAFWQMDLFFSQKNNKIFTKNGYQ